MSIVLSCFVTAALLWWQVGGVHGVDAAQAPDARTTATLRGEVRADEDSHQPLRRAIVSATGLTGVLRTVADDNGRFVFDRLPPGRYSVAATKPGYVSMSYGAVRSGNRGLPIALAAGETTEVTVLLPRGAVITGVVRNTDGRVLADVTVRLFQATVRNSVRRLESASGLEDGGLTSTRTDSSGEYRLYGLPSGEYLVAAAPLDPSGVLAPSDGKATAPPTFHPSTPFPPQASPIAVGKGEERRNVDITMSPVPAVSVSGFVAGPGDADQPIRVLMSYDTNRGEPPFAFARANPVGTDGRWSFSGVPPGRYRITATRTTPATSFGSAPTVTGWAQAEVGVAGVALSDVFLTLQPTITVVGVMSTDRSEGVPPPEISLLSFEADGPRVLHSVQRVTSGRFEIPGLLPGRYVFLEASPVWTIGSASVEGTDVGDLPFELTATSLTPSAAIAIVRLQMATVGGLLTHFGKPAPGYMMVAFATDRRYWYPQSPRVAIAVTGTDGRYVLSNLPPGEYHLAAFSALSDDEASDISLLASAATQAVSIRLLPGVHLTSDFAIR